ncbi:hypothetical protein ACFM35_04385 [Microbacterium sp. P01]|uniref:hypothetical protein n=1 Tax=unclassified Microbacterium TaxID=2609290 RepID=UPI00366D8966
MIISFAAGNQPARFPLGKFERNGPEACDHDPVIELFRIVVDGETFDVHNQDGSIQFSWVSGPNAGYGFATRRSDGAPPTAEEARAHARSFLSSIDPATGYLAE